MSIPRWTTAVLWACAACAGAEPIPKSPPSPPSSPSQAPFRPLDVSGPVPDPRASGPVSLRGILAYADENAPRLQVASARRQLADADLEAASPLLPANPELSAGVGLRESGGERGTDWRVELSQKIEIAGQRGLRLNASERDRQVAALELEELRWAVHHDVHAAFHVALLARSRLRVAERALQFAERLVAITRQRLEAGEISPLPLRLAEGELAQARQAAIAAKGAYEAARLALAELAGWPPETPPEPAGELDRPRPAPPLDQLTAAATASHPRLRSRESAVRAAEAQRTLADREAWPDPSVGVGFEHESEPAGDSGGEDVTSVFVAIPLPLWQRNAGGRARADAELGLARAELDATRQRIRARVAHAAARVDTAADRLEVYGSEILPAFEDNLDLLERAFELGEIEVLDVMVAQERFLTTQREALDAYEDYYQAVADLEATVGAELWPEESHAHDEGVAR